MYIGYEFPTLEKEEITHTQLVRYAGASGDFNPIHTVVPFAEKVGLGGVIAHGMLIMGFVGQAIGTWFPKKELLEFSVRFKAMTRPGERLIITGEIIGEEDDRWVCVAYAKNGAEVKVSAEFHVGKD
ncbi:MaoC/PaaZ C-terminal domain-containing protein [Psychrobacillus lasiicapitis]|uniref:3-hydroxyacyl-ACP dehydratase n=1 Tax=Psychrobacillus lasiicapitis TaxID=1636719 RepID=A0A544T309_9BACI|nr:MaoC/PaaZ C-terminal domain-containing protein [Psychrobacillus lasiicapitis]TQR11837.1 3-hydroxyacyl-ACP dehydratase [Psychrobacillus lasiicapitis]GGA19868.1 MaoC family dehydratase [Psychrobacillus lasiicapitis]